MDQLPRIFRVQQLWDRPVVADVGAEAERQLQSLRLAERVRSGQTVAITAGSRGIADIVSILRAAVQHLRRLGADPFIVPAMGSHGGATAHGQRRVLEDYGITEEAIGCPIRATMETVIVGQTPEGFPVHFDRHAYEAHHVLVFNRIKPHTRFAGRVQSGLMKMMLIGLGKHTGAQIYHRAILDYDFDRIARSAAPIVLERCRILAGLAVLENAYGETARIEAVPPERIIDREPQLLELARQLMPKLPFDTADVLIIDQIGKNISGTGMDTNVVGRKFYSDAAAPEEWPKIERIIVRALTPESHGNASGIGLADFCRSGIVRQMDLAATWTNCITSVGPFNARVPIHYETDRELLEAALATIGLRRPAEVRLLWIRNTLDLAELECSEAYLAEAEERSDLKVLSRLRPLQFDRSGNLVPIS